MTKSCPNCGYKYNEGDIFCAKCGLKIVKNLKVDLKSAIEQFESNVKNQKLSSAKINFSAQSVLRFFDNAVLNVVFVLIVLLFALCISMFFILKNHENQKEILQLNNLMQNPSQIPLLKEPASYDELADNLINVDKFLYVYLKNSKDNKDKKNQIFATYLNQLDKMPNVLNLKYEKDSIFECKGIDNITKCAQVLGAKFENTPVDVYYNAGLIYLYPDYKFIKKRYNNLISSEFRNYVDKKAKNSLPTSLGLELNIEPKKLADRIYDWEKLYMVTSDDFIKESLEKNMYFDFRKFIFTPSIYATATQEMKPEFKSAYLYFLRTKKDSSFRPMIMSYLNKMRSFNEMNFEADYPFKVPDVNNFSANIKKADLEDVFAQLRKNIFVQKQEKLPLAFVYDAKNAKWSEFDGSCELASGQFVFSVPDENNNVSVFNHAYSPVQELNILKYAKMYLINDSLYVFNKDKLSISKINYNGKMFSLYTLNHVDVTSLFPGVEVINIDTFPSYNIVIDKANAKANFIVVSRYSQGWNDYNFSKIKGDYKEMILPNMFSVNSNSDVVIAFSETNDNQEEFKENKPDYKFTIHTIGHKEPVVEQPNYPQYDEKTKDDMAKDVSDVEPNIMPKLMEPKYELVDSLLNVPEQKIDPPNENDD